MNENLKLEPAHGLYQGLGFELKGNKSMYAENTGTTEFWFFERDTENPEIGGLTVRKAIL